MSKATHYLKADWAKRHLDLASPLLAPGSDVKLLWNAKPLATLGTQGGALAPDTPDTLAFPLILEGQTLGVLLLRPPPGSSPETAQACGNLLAHGLHGIIEAQHARYSVAQETLESYREMALMQRAVSELNASLKPSAVAAALLKEFNGRKNASDFGGVFLRNGDSANPILIQSFGENAAGGFAKLLENGLVGKMLDRPNGDIVNNLEESPLGIGSNGDFQALLWLPLIAHGENLGLLALASRNPEGFTAADMKRAQTLVSVAASALRNAELYAAEQIMFQSFVKVIATAIDAKSPYTAGHCRRVPEIALMLAEKAHQADQGSFAAFTFDEDERNALELAAMLHDCGKVVTPEWVVDKATKLDGIHNRLELVALRFEILRRDTLIEYYQSLQEPEQGRAEQACQERLHLLDEHLAFLEKCNSGGEFISPEHVARIHEIAAMPWHNARGETFPLLDENEVYNLCTPRGTLNPEERKIIEDHAVHTIRMLSQIPFPRSLRNVTEYAGGHHERVDGRGYPRGLTREQLSIPARIMAIADIFEALTAPDRPYRKAGTLSWAIDVMYRMKQEGHIDGELFDLFLSEKVYLTYAGKHLLPNQLDQPDIARYLS